MTVGPLVTVTWLAGNLDNPALRIADCRWYLGEPAAGRQAYDAAHIPGAVYVSLEDHLSGDEGPGRHPLPMPTEFGATLGDLGIGNESIVVAYDDRGGAVAARLWWMMRWMGHEDVAVLDGGSPAWESADLPLTGLLPLHDAAVYTAPVATAMPTFDRAEVANRPHDAALLDARAAARFRGDEEPVDPIAGHIPGAVNAPYERNLDRDGRFLDKEMLRARYPTDGAIVYCGSGVTACHDILAMEIAGLPTATLYPGSWSDWSRSDGEVERG